MKQLINLLKPTKTKLLTTAVICVLGRVVFVFFFSPCLFADCIENNQLVPCCNSFWTGLASLLHRSRYFHIPLAYLAAAGFLKLRQLLTRQDRPAPVQECPTSPAKK